MLIIWGIAFLFGLFMAPWYAPAVLSFVYALTWLTIAMQANTISPDAFAHLGVLLATILSCWVIGRGLRHAYDQWRTAN